MIICGLSQRVPIKRWLQWTFSLPSRPDRRSPTESGVDGGVPHVALHLLLSFTLIGCTQGPPRFTLDRGAIVRGDITRPEIALVFTGDEYADGAEHIRQVLDSLDVKGSFFFTGRFYRTAAFASDLRALKADGHYLGAHSDQHLLYCSWENRDSVLVSRDEFRKDVLDNYLEMKRFGIDSNEASFFLPAYEWYNDQVSEWTTDLGFTLINYSPGTRSHADYTTPNLGDNYLSSDEILDSIWSFEESEEQGLNGFILLSHIGVAPERFDKFYFRLGPLITELRKKGYVFVRIDDLLSE